VKLSPKHAHCSVTADLQFIIAVLIVIQARSYSAHFCLHLRGGRASRYAGAATAPPAGVVKGGILDSGEHSSVGALG